MDIYYDKIWEMLRKITRNYSPNFSTIRRKSKNIKFIVIHYTGMKSENEAIKRLISGGTKVSSHFFVKKKGGIILMVPENYIAWHSGKSNWRNYKSLNKYSIGIEVQNSGHSHKYTKFKKEQIKSVIKICKYLMKKYKITKPNVLGHSDISYNRKKDPGENFPWKLLSKKNISVWHDLNKNKTYPLRNCKVNLKDKEIFLKNLRYFGYLKPKSTLETKQLTEAFQRRFRPELISGKIDEECLIISKKLRKI